MAKEAEDELAPLSPPSTTPKLRSAVTNIVQRGKSARVDTSEASWESDSKEMGIYWHDEMVKPAFGGTYDEYLEMCLQFGFITIFGVAMPVGVFWAWLNNVTEIRVDAKNLVKVWRRPPCREAEDIGSWFHVLSSLAVVAVATNALIIGFVSTVLVQSWYWHDYISTLQYCTQIKSIMARYSHPYNVYFVLCFENFLLLFKYMLSACISNVAHQTNRDRDDLKWFVKRFDDVHSIVDMEVGDRMMVHVRLPLAHSARSGCSF